MPEPYHAALRPPVDAPATHGASLQRGTVFVHDLIAAPLPDVYGECDVLYADLPWRTGYAIYNERAGITRPRAYGTFLTTVAAEVRRIGRPAVLVTGQHAVKRLQPDRTRVTELNGQAAVACLFGDIDVADTGDTRELLGLLAHRYRTVGDFCCGYGRTVRAVLLSGGRFVASDFNPTCVGYVAAHAGEWAARYA